jgi:hypothetical protein
VVSTARTSITRRRCCSSSTLTRSVVPAGIVPRSLQNRNVHESVTRTIFQCDETELFVARCYNAPKENNIRDPQGLKGEKRPADVIGNAVIDVMRIATAADTQNRQNTNPTRSSENVRRHEGLGSLDGLLPSYLRGSFLAAVPGIEGSGSTSPLIACSHSVTWFA